MAEHRETSENSRRVRIDTGSESEEDQFPLSPSPGQGGEGERTPRPSLTVQQHADTATNRAQERFPRFRHEDTQSSHGGDESTRLLSGSRERHVRLSTSRERRDSNDSHLYAPGFRHRASAWANAQPSPSPARPRSNTLSRRSIAIAATTTGRDADTISRKFSLAGPAPLETVIANQPYVDPGYSQLNPAYDQPSNTRPVWSLAKPLPRVIRPGMVPTTSELHVELVHKHPENHKDIDIENGRIEPSLRPDKIAHTLDNIREERELNLVESYGKLSPFPSPYHGESSDPTGFFSPRNRGTSAHHDSDNHTEPDLSHLSNALAQVEESKLGGELYEDAVPLKAYEAEIDEIHNLHTYWSVIRLRFREPLAELLAITVQFTIGFSANLSMTVSRGRAGAGDTTDLAWGLATMIAIYIAGGISGAHLNPAMSLMLYIYRGFPLSKMPIYITAQLLGAFLATLIAFGIFQPGIMALGEPNLALSGTAGNFITFPRNEWVSRSAAFSTEFVATTILGITVLALGDDANAPPGAGMNALIIGLVIAVLSMAFGWNTGLAMNPVRDFGPRLALLALGYGKDYLFGDNYWFVVAWLGPLSGAVLGGFLYDAAIFVGGESPVNYPPKRMKRAARKWKKRWVARIRRTNKKVQGIKDDVGYGTIDRSRT